eukprot:15462582-Alexandrium_andersonii.AAC.1
MALFIEDLPQRHEGVGLQEGELAALIPLSPLARQEGPGVHVLEVPRAAVVPPQVGRCALEDVLDPAQGHSQHLYREGAVGHGVLEVEGL